MKWRVTSDERLTKKLLPVGFWNTDEKEKGVKRSKAIRKQAFLITGKHNKFKTIISVVKDWKN